MRDPTDVDAPAGPVNGCGALHSRNTRHCPASSVQILHGTALATCTFVALRRTAFRRFGQAAFGDTETTTALLTGAAWVINLAIAEWLMRRRFIAPDLAPGFGMGGAASGTDSF
jgi:hypothetical protein